MIDTNNKDMQELIHQQVMEALSKSVEFSNVARPKPTKASTAASSTWKGNEAPRPSAATQGSWDSTDTPGGVSSLAKEKWTAKEIAALVTRVLSQNGISTSSEAFANKPVPEPTTVSASTQPSWKTYEEEPVRKPAAGTQGAWDTTDSPGGVSSEAKKVWTPQTIALAVTKVLAQNGIEITPSAEFSNKPVPEPTTISASTQPSWKTYEEEPVRKPAAGTQGAWDTTDSPGGVSSEAKKVWTPQAIAALVRQTLKEEMDFANMPVPKPTTVSGSTQAAWKEEKKHEPKASAATQALLKKEDQPKPSAATQAAWK